MITGLSLTPLGLGFGQLLQQAGGIQPEFGGGGELGDDVVVVGIEPLGHLAGGHPAAAPRLPVGGLGRTAAGDSEIIVQRVALEVPHALGQVAQREAHVQHLIVEGEIADRNQV